MKVLFTSPSLGYGGAEGYLGTIARAAVNGGLNAAVALHPGAALNPLAAQLDREGCTVHRAPVAPEGGRLNRPGQILAAVRMLSQVRPDVVHLTLPWPDLGLPLMLACALRHVPAFAVFQLVGEGYYRPWVRWPLRWTRAAGQQWIAVSHANRRLLARDLGVAGSEIGVIHNGADPPPPSRADLRSELNLPPDAPLVATVGRLHRQKGQDLAIAIAPAVLRRHPDTRFVFAGEGPAATMLQRLAREFGVEDKVLFLGHRDDVPRILRSSTVFLFPSRYEGLPFALLEAMHCGVPVVAAGAGGVPELVRDRVDGIVVAPEDTQGLTEGVLRLLDGPEARAQLAVAARERAAEFGERRMVQETLDGLFACATRDRPTR